MEDEKVIRQLLTEIGQQLKPISELSVSIAMRADLQAYTETMYDQLVQLAYVGIEFLQELNEGDIITSDWVERRDELVSRAHRLIADAPNARDE